jgi:hypothetical protein
LHPVTVECHHVRDLIAAVVALANTEGGDLLLRLKDEGKISQHGAKRYAFYTRP